MIGPTMDEMLDQVLTSRLQTVYTSLPGRVVSFAAATSTCTVQPFPAIYQDGEAVELPLLYGVPVGYPSGGGSSITWPLLAGDIVILLFASAPLSRYRVEGAETDPQEERRFDLTDAWAMPLAGGAQPPATSGALVVQAPTAGQVRLGASTATLGVARQTDSVQVTVAPDWIAFATAVSAITGVPAPVSVSYSGSITGASTTVRST